jgi:hypothetical protein
MGYENDKRENRICTHEIFRLLREVTLGVGGGERERERESRNEIRSRLPTTNILTTQKIFPVS